MIDFIRLLEENNIPYKNEVENWININCPYHSNGRRGFKGGINLAGGFFHCWNCGGHQIEKVFSDILQISFYEAKKLLQEYDTDIVIKKKVKKHTNNKDIILPGVKIEKNDMAYSYLSRRDFSPFYLVENYRIVWGNIVGEYSFRIIIPIYYKGQLISFQARSIYSKEKCSRLGILRYKNYPIELSKINPKHILYNLDNCLEDWVVVVEGNFDCWRLGPKNICSCMGTSMSEEQIILLAERYKKIIFLFDNEKQAQNRAKKYGERLSGLGVEVEIFNPEFEHDPGDYTKKEEKFVRKEFNLF